MCFLSLLMKSNLYFANQEDPQEFVQKYDTLHVNLLIFNNSFLELYLNPQYKTNLLNLLIELLSFS